MFPQERQMLFRVKNELDNHPYKSKTDIFKQLSENKSTGVISGPSDFIYVLTRICFIELKLEGKKQSKDQEEFQQKVEARGHLYFLVEEPLEHFQELILNLQKRYGR